jgi:hypothetical protein
MPRYFFNTEDGRRYPDEDGSELPNLVAVRLEATRIMAELLKEQPQDFLQTGRLRVEVTDDRDRKVLVLDVAVTCEAA